MNTETSTENVARDAGQTETETQIVVAITSEQYWGKGKNVEEALAQCRKAGAHGSQDVLLYAYLGTEENLKHVGVNSFGDVEYPRDVKSIRIGMLKMNVNQPTRFRSQKQPPR